MAISKGFKSADVQEYKRYIGVSPVFVKAVNPNKKQHEELFNTTLDETPNYVTDAEDSNGNTYKNARIQIVLQMAQSRYNSDAELLADYNNNEGTKVTMSLFIQNRPRVGSATGKIQVIDKYGRTAWATQNDVDTHSIPMYSNGPADIDKDFRPAYVGEEELVAFVKAYLGIEDITVWNNELQKRVPNPKVKPEECECRFDNLDKIFKGDFSEIIDTLSFQPTNRVKVLLGVRIDTESGRMYQSVYTKVFTKNNNPRFNAFEKSIDEMLKNAAANGRTLNTEYRVIPVQEYTVEPTTFTPETNNVSDLPFGTTDNSDCPW